MRYNTNKAAKIKNLLDPVKKYYRLKFFKTTLTKILNKIRGGIEFITIFTTVECNYNCVYCYTKERRKGENILHIDDFKDVIIQSKRMGAKKVYFFGPGEPLMNQLNYGLIEFVNKNSMTPHIFTNGSLITEEVADFLYRNKTEISYKIHSLDAATSDYLSGIKDSNVWVDYSQESNSKQVKIPSGLRELLLIKKKDKTFYIRIEVPILKSNLVSIIEVANFIKANSLDFLFETLIITEGLNKYKKAFIPEREECIQLFQELKKILGRQFIEQQGVRRCFIRRNPVIWENGDLSLCAIERADIGNVLKENLKELWKKRLRLKENKTMYNDYVFRTCPGREL